VGLLAGGGYLLSLVHVVWVGYLLFLLPFAGLAAYPLLVLASLFFRADPRPPLARADFHDAPPPDPASLEAKIDWQPPAIRRPLLRRQRLISPNAWRAFLAALLILAVLCGGGGYLLYRTPVDQWGDAVRFSDHLEIFHGQGVSQEEAEALGRFMLARGIGTPGHPATLRLRRGDEGYQLYLFTTDEDVLADEDKRNAYRQFRDEISQSVLGGSRLTLFLCSRNVTQGRFGALAEPRVITVLRD
jgi:hypothetical protein